MKKKTIANKTQRIGDRFNTELEKIKDRRIELKIDKTRRSTRELTNLITRHNSWEEIKEDLVKVNPERYKDE